MRYIGNKTKILGEIDNFLTEKGLKTKGLVFFDAFSGTASVSHKYKDFYKIIANDYLYYAYIWTESRLNSPEKMFDTLGFDPFVFFNSEKHTLTGFVTKNYAPKLSGRMYFSDENAQKIDFIRTTIEDWFQTQKIDIHEKYYLIASLLESVSKVANVAGVYGSYLKDWDSRAMKSMKFIPIDEKPFKIDNSEVYNEDISNLINKVEGDILYLDPPYTKNQYSIQYHILETIAKNDNPILKGKTGARNMSEFASDFSKQYKVNVAFENLIAKAKFKHIIFSYSSDGLMSKEFIEAVLKRYGKPETFEFRKINYQRYKNAKAERKEDHSEYLFYIEKTSNPIFASPLNYIGGKYDMIDFIKQYVPTKIETFWDLFGGGANVVINITAKKHIYNDINFKVKELLEYISKCNISQFYQNISKKIQKYGLSAGNKDAYLSLRKKYNSDDLEKRNFEDLFLLVMYGFNQQIRFNSFYDYNNPVGMACFNEKVLEKLISFSNISKRNNICFKSADYQSYFDDILPNDFVYIDPPYLITLGSYNDGKRGFNGWNEREEIMLYDFIDALHKKGVKFMLSNVLEHNNKQNIYLNQWIKNRHYNCIEYPNKARKSRKEIIVINY